MTLIISYIALFQSFLPLLYYWFIKKKIVQECKPILPFIYLCFISGFYELVFSMHLRINLVPWYFIYDILSFFTILFYFYYILDIKNKVFFATNVLLYLVLFFFTVKNHTSENYLSQISYLVLFTTLFILVCSIIWFKTVSTQTSEISLIQNHNFYFGFGFLIYYTGTVVLFLLSNFIHRENISQFVNYWMLNVFFSILHKTFLIIGLWKAQKN